MQIRNPALAVAFVLCTFSDIGFAQPDPKYLVCKQSLIGSDITYDEWIRAQPNIFLIGYKWKVHVELESVVPGLFDEKMIAEGEFEITDKPDPVSGCLPDLAGKYDATVDWKAWSMPDCSRRIFGGTVTDTGEIDGVASKDGLVIRFYGINRTEKYTDRCPFPLGNVEHEKDFHLVSSTDHSVPYKDGEDTASSPYFHNISKLKIEAECPVDLTVPPPLLLDIRAVMPLVIFDHSLTGAQIRNLVSRPLSLADNSGLTVVHVSPRFSADTSGSNARFGDRKCMWVDRIKLDMSYPAVRVYVAAEYPTGSCNYSVTLAHENEHVKVAKDLLAKHEARAKSELERAAIPHKKLTMVVTNFGKGQSQIDVLVKQIIDRLLQDFRKEIQTEFARLDDPTNYQHLRAQCSSW